MSGAKWVLMSRSIVYEWFRENFLSECINLKIIIISASFYVNECKYRWNDKREKEGEVDHDGERKKRKDEEHEPRDYAEEALRGQSLDDDRWEWDRKWVKVEWGKAGKMIERWREEDKRWGFVHENPRMWRVGRTNT